MEKRVYISPQVETLQIAFEQGFASSGIDVDVNVNPWEGGPSWGDHDADEY